MAALRKKANSAAFAGPKNDFVVDYSNDVTPEQVRKTEEAVRKEFDRGNWVTVEPES